MKRLFFIHLDVNRYVILRDKRLHEKDLTLSLSDEAYDAIGELGFDPVYGARPLKRAIQRHLENPLAQMLLRGDYQPGDTIEVSVHNGELAFNKAAVLREVV